MNQPKILMVDDEPRNLRILEGILAPLAYDLQMAADGLEALSRVAEDPPDILLLDVMMPGITGFEVCRQLKENPATRFIPIVMVTALSEREMRLNGLEAGADDFITKPVDPHELRARVRSLLRIKSLHDELQQRNEELERLERMRKTLTQMIAYDLRTAHTGMICHLQQISAYLQQALESKTVVILLRSLRDGALWATAQTGITDEILGRVWIPVESMLCTALSRRQTVDLTSHISDEDRFMIEQIHGALLVPIILKGELYGIVSLGEKWSGSAYTAEDRSMLMAVADQVAVSIDHVRLRGQEQEVETARDIQLRLLPETLPQMAGFELEGAWLPARIIGGDYYDAFHVGENRIGFCIADVSGKGVPAALLMSNVQASVKAIVSEFISPKELCQHINRIMYRNMNTDKFVTFFYGLLDITDRRLVYTNAGHNLPLLVRHDGSHSWLYGGGTVLGVFEDWPYEEHEVTLLPGDRLVLYTDGVTEVRDADGAEFGEERLARLVLDHQTLGAAALHGKVLEAIDAFGAGEVHDDVTLLVLAATGKCEV